jgi:hypothetical protein
VNSNIVYMDVIPAAPTGITVVASGDGSQVNWTDASSNETRFEVYVKDSVEGNPNSFGAYTLISTTPPNATGVLDFGPLGRNHYYRVRACNNAGCSAYATSTLFFH